MKDLFAKKSVQVLEEVCTSKALYAFDFDGTLAPFVKDPSKAKMRLSTKRLLERLVKLASVAVVSSRPKKELTKLCGCNPEFLIGNCGLEETGLNVETLHDIEKVCQKWLVQIESSSLKLQGIEIENKKYSIAIHYRKSREREFNHFSLMQICSNLIPAAKITQGKCVINLNPTLGLSKGDVLSDLMRNHQYQALLYIGDDTRDEEVFSHPLANFVSIHVGEKQNSAAKYFIRNQKQIDSVLKTLLLILERPTLA